MLDKETTAVASVGPGEGWEEPMIAMGRVVLVGGETTVTAMDQVAVTAAGDKVATTMDQVVVVAAGGDKVATATDQGVGLEGRVATTTTALTAVVRVREMITIGLVEMVVAM